MSNQAERPVAVITGASSGIGKEAARALIGQNWMVIGLGRNAERCEQARKELLDEAASSDQVVMIRADLALMADVERVAKEVASLTDRVDALLNNAGGLTAELTLTSEGNENTFASNRLGHFLLTQRLLPLLQAAATASPTGCPRIINVSSAAHEHCEGLDWDDLQMTGNFHSMVAYCRVKLANLLFTRELARRVAGDGIVVHAMHPGLVASNFFNHGDEHMQGYLETKGDEADLPEEAADTLIWLACADEPCESSGDYFHKRTPVPMSAAARDDEAAARLWEESEKLVAGTVGN